MAYRKFDNDDVQITLSADQFTSLLLAIGVATGSACMKDNQAMAEGFIELANAVNDGNPSWNPYIVREQVEKIRQINLE
jgi:hypothetical protein